MQSTDKKYIFLFVFMLFGIVIAIQGKSTLYAKSQNASTSLNVERLINAINSEQKRNDSLKAEIDKNVIIQQQSIKAFIEEKNDYNLMSDWENIILKAGMTDVKGPGIIMKLDDAPARKNDDPQQLLIIHDQDIKILLNDLKKAGAQAISINGERVAAMSEQVCAGPTILINRNRYSVPYIINVIGDPELLYESITQSERVADMIECQIRIETVKSKEVVVPKYSNIYYIDKLISGLEVINSEIR